MQRFIDNVGPSLDFKVFGQRFESLAAACANKIEREWPRQFSGIPLGQIFFLGHIKAATNIYETVLFICAEKRRDPFQKPEFSLVLQPPLRTLLDGLFNITFALEDFPARVERFNKAGWRESKERLDRYLAKYGSRPEWNRWFEANRTNVERGKTLFGISPAEESNMRLIEYWPIPSRMPGSTTAVKSPDLRAFMAFLQDWFYRDPSAMFHLTLSGLIMQAGPLLKLPPYTDEYEQRIPLWKSQQLGMALVLTLAQISEVEAAFLVRSCGQG